MLTLVPVLAAFAPAMPLDNNPGPEAHAPNLFGLGLRDMLLIVGVAVVLGLILFLWAYLTHKSRRRATHRGSKVITRAEKLSPEQMSAKGVKVRRKRRRHPDNLPRNPTLGETGGLPPIRPEEPPAEAAPQ